MIYFSAECKLADGIMADVDAADRTISGDDEANEYDSTTMHNDGLFCTQCGANQGLTIDSASGNYYCASCWQDAGYDVTGNDEGAAAWPNTPMEGQGENVDPPDTDAFEGVDKDMVTQEQGAKPDDTEEGAPHGNATQKGDVESQNAEQGASDDVTTQEADTELHYA